MRRRIAAATCALVLGAVVLGGGSPAVAKRRVQVKRVELTVEDTARSRQIEVVVSYPARDGKPPKKALPLVVFATGYGGDAMNYAPLYDFWVRAGYAVSALTFPDLTSQPQDLKFMRDEVLRISEEGSEKRFPKLDPDRVALAGKSLGAIASFDLAFSPDHHDDVFKAVIAMTGAAGTGARLEDYPTPLLLIHGDADELVSVSGSEEAYARASGPKFFVTILGGSHGSAFGGGDSPSEEVVETVTVDFLDLHVKGKKSALRRLERHAEVEGVATLQAAP